MPHVKGKHAKRRVCMDCGCYIGKKNTRRLCLSCRKMRKAKPKLVFEPRVRVVMVNGEKMLVGGGKT